MFYVYLVFQTIAFFSLPMKITPKESSSTPLHFEFSLSFSLFNGETTEKRCADFQITYSLLQAKLTYSAMLWTQASRVIQTVKRPSSLTDSLTDSLTYSNQLKQHYHSLPRCPSTLFLCSCALWFSICVIFEAICGFPLCGAWRHGTEGSVDSTGPAGIVARWSVLLVSDWARPSAGVQREKHTTQYPVFPIPSVRCAACLCFSGRDHVCVCVYVSWITTVKTSCLVDVVSGS